MSQGDTGRQAFPDVAALDTVTLAGLIDAGKRELAERIERERKIFIREVRERAAALGFDENELPLPFGKKGTRTPRKPQYRNPRNPSQTWSGRGAAPKWLCELEAQGHPREKFLIH